MGVRRSLGVGVGRRAPSPRSRAVLDVGQLLHQQLLRLAPRGCELRGPWGSLLFRRAPLQLWQIFNINLFFNIKLTTSASSSWDAKSATLCLLSNGYTGGCSLASVSCAVPLGNRRVCNAELQHSTAPVLLVLFIYLFIYLLWKWSLCKSHQKACSRVTASTCRVN